MFSLPALILDGSYLKKIGGNGKTSVDVCKVSADGEASNVWSFTIDSGDDNDSHTWSKTLKNMSGYVLTLHLDGKSLTKKLQYELKATMHESPAATHTASAK